MPALPESLQILRCINCNLRQLPNLPQSLNELNVSNNELTDLPELPNSLKLLQVKSNKLTSLPDPLPSNLKVLDFDNNMITIVPELPNSLQIVTGRNNPLSQLPRTPQSVSARFDDIWAPIMPLSNYPSHSQYPLETNNPLPFNPNQKTYDAINGEEISIQEYLSQPEAEEEQFFVLHLNGEYICQSLKGIRISNSETTRPTDYVEYYECKNRTPPEWQGNTYIRDWLKSQGRGPFVKIMGPGGSKYLVDKPSFFWNGPVPGSKVFNMVETPKKVNKYVSSHILPVRPGFNAMGADHCNQIGPERLFRLELMVPENQSAGKKRRSKSKKQQSKRKKQQKSKKTRKIRRKNSRK